MFMRLRLGDFFRVRRVTFSCSKEWGVRGRGSQMQKWVTRNATHSILFLPPTPLSSPWIVVSEYRASLQRRLHPNQEEGAFQSPPPSDVGGKSVLPDCTPAPTPTEVSIPHLQGRACYKHLPGSSFYQLVQLLD